jgi:hypothetical protein
VALQDNPSRADLCCLLVAADARVDPHLLVGLCCERAADDPLSVSLLVPADDDSGAWSEGSARGGAPGGSRGHAVGRCRLRAGRAVRVEIYREEDRALEAAGLAEPAQQGGESPEAPAA